MDPIGNQAPTSEYGVIRSAQKTTDAGVLKLIDRAGGGGNAPPEAPVQAEPKDGSTIHVVA